MKQKQSRRGLKIAALVLAAVLIGILVKFYTGFYGNPISKMMANNEIKKYLAVSYHDRKDFEIENINYNFKDGRYWAQVQSNSSADTNFSVGWRSNQPIIDDYAYRVLEGQNTVHRLFREAGRDIAGKLKTLGDMRVHVTSAPEEPRLYFELDTPYKQGLIDTSHIQIELPTEEHTAEAVAELGPQIFKQLSEAGYPLQELDLTLVKSDFKVTYKVYGITPELALSDDFLEQLKAKEQLFETQPEEAYKLEDFRVIINK